MAHHGVDVLLPDHIKRVPGRAQVVHDRPRPHKAHQPAQRDTGERPRVGDDQLRRRGRDDNGDKRQSSHQARHY